MDDVHDDALLRKLGDLVLKCLQGARHVGLEDHGELLDLARGGLREDLLETHLAGLLAGERLGLEALASLLRKLAGAAVVLDALESLTCLRDVVYPEDLSGITGPGRINARAGEVEHGADLAPRGAGDYRVTDPHRAPVDEHGRDRAASGIEVRLDD